MDCETLINNFINGIVFSMGISFAYVSSTIALKTFKTFVKIYNTENTVDNHIQTNFFNGGINMEETVEDITEENFKRKSF